MFTYRTFTGKNAALFAISLTAGFGLLPARKAEAHSRSKTVPTAPHTRRSVSPLFCQADNQTGSSKIIGQDAYEKMVNALADIVTDPILNRPNGSESRREAAFRGVSVVYSGIMYGAIALPVAGGAIGAGVGAIVGLAPGAVAGGLIGSGVGITLGTAEFITGLVLISDMTLKINDRYPPTTAALTGPAGSRYCGAGKAGPWESLVVSLMKSGFNDKVVQLADSWDAMAGLSAAQRRMLQENRAFQPSFQHIAQIRQTDRIAPNAPVAQPLSGWMQSVERVLAAGGDSEQMWMEALGIGAAQVRVLNGRLQVNMPPALVALGANARYQADLPQVAFKVGGNGGALDPYFRCEMKMGDFDLQAGHPSIMHSGPHAGMIRVAYTVTKGSTPGGAKLALKWNGPEATLSAFAPTLKDDLSADLYFRVGKDGMEFDSITLGNTNIRPNLPGNLPTQLPGISTLTDQLTGSLQKGISDNFVKPEAWQEAFRGVGSAAPRSLERSLNATAGQYGLTEIRRVKSLEVKNGKLQATVEGTQLKLPPQILTVDQINEAYRKRIASLPLSPVGRTRPTLPSTTRSPF